MSTVDFENKQNFLFTNFLGEWIVIWVRVGGRGKVNKEDDKKNPGTPLVIAFYFYLHC